MSWGAAIGAGSSLLGGLFGSSSAKSAAKIQAAAADRASQAQLTAAREANALQEGMYRQQIGMQAPAFQGGQKALSALMSGLGLGNLQAYQNPNPQGGVPLGRTNAQGQTVDGNGNVVGPSGLSLGDLNIGASQEDLDASGNQYANTFGEQFTGQDIYLDPSYDFRLSEGERLLRARQGAAGNRFSGQAMKDITNYGQEAASQEYANANDRFLKNKALLWDRLSGIAGIGQSAGNTAANAGTNAANQMGANTIGAAKGSSDYLTSGAAATAAGKVGATNALVGGVNQGLNNYYTMSYLRGNQGNQPTGQGYGSLYDVPANGYRGDQ